MTLLSGTRFGVYQITGPLGVGGMGEVYRARDTTLEREVAIKVLPETFAQDADRVARFEREARTLASLNHNNIAQIYGIEKGVVSAIVMELVEGPTLADRIAEGPIAPEEALRIARQIIDGLEAAHDKGIVHRDLKPSNIKVTADGLVKILDFGIAKSVDTTHTSGRHTPTMVTPAVTESGVIMGTAAYMSPEQARGKFVDQRTDIWAFACVLCEMLTGQPAFAGQDAAETMARIITLEADTRSLPGAVSPMVRHTIAMCLQKDVKKRIADIRDVRLALAGNFETGHVPATSVQARRRVSIWISSLATVAVVLAAVLATSVYFAPESEAPEVRRFVSMIPGALELKNPSRASLSPDGRYALLSASKDGQESQLWLWSLDSLEPTPLQGTAGVDVGAWSPDSRQIAFVQNASLKRMPIDGGPAQTVLGSGLTRLTRGPSVTWGTDGTILFTHADGGLARVSAEGGEPVLVTRQIENEAFAHDELPAFLPGGRRFLYFRHSTSADITGIYQGSLDVEPAAQNYSRLLRATDGTVFLPGAEPDAGLILFGLGASLHAQAFNPLIGELAGDAIPLEENMSDTSGWGQFSTSANGGLLTLMTGTSSSFRNSAFLVPATGEKTDLGPMPTGIYEAVASPDGSTVALAIYGDNPESSFTSEIWIWSRTRQNLRLLTTEPGLHVFPHWSADGSELVYLNFGTGIFRRRADGTGTAELLYATTLQTAFDLSADRLFLQTTVEGGEDIFEKDLEAGAEAEVLVAHGERDAAPALSGDGRWLAYMSNVSGSAEVYVRPYPAVEEGLWLVSSGGGNLPRWSSDGSALFYVNPTNRKLMRVRFDSNPVFAPGAPEEVLDMSTYLLPGDFGIPAGYVYDWIAAESSLLVIEPQDRPQGGNTQVLMIENRFHELLNSGNR